MNPGIRKIGVVGAGAMGRGIAQICAAAGCEVQLFDMDTVAIGRACEAVREDLVQGVKRGRSTQADADATLSRIRAADDLEGFASCDLVVEAIVEKLDAKQSLFCKLESIVGLACVLATNTSSLSVTAIASGCTAPQRVVGWHFFNPVPRMRLVEVVQAPRTHETVVSALVELSTRIGHRAVVTSDTPGFVVNHAGRAYVTEGLKMLAERTADHAVLDAILRTSAGFRMGPFELLDLTGLDVSVPVMESIHDQYYGDDRYRPVALARTRMVAGLLGRKSKAGFYQHGDASGPTEPNEPTEPASLRCTDVDPLLKVWWPTDGVDALPNSIAGLLPLATRCDNADTADLVLLAPLGADLSSTLAGMPGIDAAKVIAVDPLFASPSAVTLMRSPATAARTVHAAQHVFAVGGVKTFVVADSPGYVAPRVVACIVNLACEMAQQGIATPADLDAAVRLGLGYPFGPFEWGDCIGAKCILTILRGLHRTFGDPRYRPSPWLVRRADLSLSLSAPEQAG